MLVFLMKTHTDPGMFSYAGFFRLHSQVLPNDTRRKAVASRSKSNNRYDPSSSRSEALPFSILHRKTGSGERHWMCEQVTIDIQFTTIGYFKLLEFLHQLLSLPHGNH